MTARWTGRTALALGASLFIAACGGRDRAGKAVPESPEIKAIGAARDEVPSDQLSAVMIAHYRGLGAMERYEYAVASEAFREVHRRAPGWTPGTVNLAIALLNQGGESEEKTRSAPGAGEEVAATSNLDESIKLLDEVIAAHPDNPWAHFSRGIVLRTRGMLVEAHADFRKVTEIDPGDPNAWLELGETLGDPDQPGMKAGRSQAKELVAIFSKALELNPYFVTAMYKLGAAYRLAGDFDAQSKLLAAFKLRDPKQNPAATGEAAKLIYGEMGKYAAVIDPFPRPKEPKQSAPAPRFAVPKAISITLADGDRWAKASDLVGPSAVIARARSRVGMGLATIDVDGDGDVDLYLTASVVGPKGVRDALLINDGEGRFHDATVGFGLPVDRAGLGIAAGDFDADRRLDLFLTGVGNNRLYRNLGARFEDVTASLGTKGAAAISPTARWLDLDQDGDLDLYVVNYSEVGGFERAFTGKDEPAGLVNVAYRNDGKPSKVGQLPENSWVPVAATVSEVPATEGLSIAFSAEFPGATALAGGLARHTAIAALDIDEDRDIDLVLGSDDQGPRAILNDRAGEFREAPLADLKGLSSVSGLLVSDLNKDGRPDLFAIEAGGKTSAWSNGTTRSGSTTKLAWASIPINARGWRGATAFDVDLDTWPDLIGLPSTDRPTPMAWARNAGTRLEASGLPIPPDGTEATGLAGFALANLVGDALPDVVTIRDGQGPMIARNLGNGNHWLNIDLGGRWKTGFDQMRTNPQGLGTRLALEGQGIYAPYDHTTTTAGPAQSVGPVVLGMGDQLSAPLLRIRWPDGVMQCELNVTADKTLALAEQSRKTGSCPVLFTWKGDRF